MTRVKRILLWGTFSAAAMVGSGLLLADQLTPAANGVPSHALPLSPDQTVLDRELVPLLARNPGKTGALMLTDGIDAFAARAISARQAGRSLDLQYYIWHDDLTGRLLVREAWLAAERGVRVRLLLDDINAGGKDDQLLVLDSHANIEVRLYNPFRNRGGMSRLLEMLQRVFSMNHRMHNKAWIADGRVAVVGGRNIGLEYFSASEDANFHDLDLLLFGPAVADADAIFDAFWNSGAAVPLAGLHKARDVDAATIIAAIGGEVATPAAQRYLERVESSPGVRAYLEQDLAPHWSDRIEVVSDPPLKRSGDDQDGWLVHRIDASLRGARHAALLISPYFVPGDDITAGLTGLAARGVHVGVVTNSLAANDVAAVHGGYSKYRKPLLAGGVHLNELRRQAANSSPAQRGKMPEGQMGATSRECPADVCDRSSTSFGSGFGSGSSSGASLHTKAFLVDRSHGFIGSYNLDPRSAYLNTEMGVIFDHAGLADALRAEYLHLAGAALSYRVDLDEQGDLRWLDRAAVPPILHTREPDADLWPRVQATIFRWLPLDSQL